MTGSVRDSETSMEIQGVDPALAPHDDTAMEIEALKNEVDRLRWRRDHLAARQSRPHPDYWHGVALRQYRLRKRAEQFNVRLQQAVRSKRERVDALTGAVQKAEQLRQDPDAFSLFLATIRDSDVFNNRSSSVKGSMLDRLDHMSESWQHFFKKHQKLVEYVSRVNEWDFVETHLEHCRDRDAKISATSSTIYRFPASDVLTKIWELHSNLQCERDHFSQRISRNALDNFTLDGNLHISASCYGIDGAMDARSLCRKFRAVNGDLVIASTICGKLVLHGKNAPTAEVVLCEDTWVRIIAVQDAQSHWKLPPLTLVQYVRRTRVQGVGAGRLDPACVRATHKLLASVVTNQHQWGRPAIERELVRLAHHDRECIIIP